MDVEALTRADHAGDPQRADRLQRCAFDDHIGVALAEGEWELVSFAPVESGFAALGLADKFNSTGAIVERRWQNGARRLVLRDGGRFLAWSQRRPSAVLCEGRELMFAYDEAECSARSRGTGARQCIAHGAMAGVGLSRCSTSSRSPARSAAA